MNTRRSFSLAKSLLAFLFITPSLLATVQDVATYGLTKGISYNQTDSSTVTIASGSPYVFQSFVDTGNGGSVSSASFNKDSATTQLTVSSDGIQFKASYASQNALDSAYPNGSAYSMTMVTVDQGTKGPITLTFGSDKYPTNPPQLSNYTQAQSINPSADFTFQWNSTGLGSSDFVQISVEDSNGNSVFQSPPPNDGSHLTGTATSYTMPAGTLSANTGYQVVLLFAGLGSLDQSTYSGATGFAAFYKKTKINISTTSASSGGPDVFAYFFAKGIEFTQIGTSSTTTDNYAFIASVNGTGDNTVTSGSFNVGANTTSLNLDVDQLVYQQAFSTKTGGNSLDSTFPNASSYNISFVTAHDGTKNNLSLAFPSTDAYPNTPLLSNSSAAQSIDPTQDFTLNWGASGMGTTDFIQVSVSDQNDNTIYESPGLNESGQLNGTATSLTIPSGSLSGSSSYTVAILFAKLSTGNTQTNGSYSGVLGTTAFFKRTSVTVSTIAVNDNTPPTLVSNSPNQESNVSVISSVSFTFSEPMSSGYSINWSDNVNANNFSYVWSSDKMTLLCIYNTYLPTSETITWTLNPTGSSQNFKDLAGNPLSSDISGQFTTSSQSGTGLKDVQSVFIGKQSSYSQSGTTSTANNQFQFFASVNLNGFNTISNANAHLSPSGVSVDLMADYDAFDFQDSNYSDANSLNSAYPDGTYIMNIGAIHDGNKQLTLPLNGNFTFTDPRISNYTAAQAINPTNAFTLTWDALVGGTSTDFISLEIKSTNDDNTVFRTPDSGVNGALDGTATSVQIPAGTLAPGRTYNLHLILAKGSGSDTSYTGVSAFSFYAKKLSLTIHTTGTPVPVSLEVLAPNGSNFQFRVHGQFNAQYDIEYSDDLSSWNQYNTQTANSPSGTFQGYFDFTDGGSSGLQHRYYRVHEFVNNQGGGGN